MFSFREIPIVFYIFSTILIHMEKAVFIDRDGVINQDLGKYVTKPEEFIFLNRSIEALKKLHESDYKVIIITNQGGVGKGLYSEKDVEDIHKKMCVILEKEGIKLDGIYYCPHHPKESCGCRKPRLGMVNKAIEEHKIDPKKSFFIGDKTSDVKAGKDAGCKTFLVKTGYAGHDKLYDIEPDFVVSDILEAANRILATK